jgi:hypothetical protein
MHASLAAMHAPIPATQIPTNIVLNGKYWLRANLIPCQGLLLVIPAVSDHYEHRTMSTAVSSRSSTTFSRPQACTIKPMENADNTAMSLLHLQHCRDLPTLSHATSTDDGSPAKTDIITMQSYPAHDMTSSTAAMHSKKHATFTLHKYTTFTHAQCQ